MKISMTREDATKLFLQGTLVLSRITSNGIRVDSKAVEKANADLSIRIKEKTDRLLEHDFGKKWKNKYGKLFTFRSNDQLSYILFEYAKFTPLKTTTKGSNSVDVDVIQQLYDSTHNEFLGDLLELRKLEKAKSTYLTSLTREVTEDGFLRPFFRLSGVVSYRSSSSSCNFQNFPNRDVFIKNIIRGCLFPREGRQLIEFDYSGAEVKCSYCYHLDPNMRKYLLDPTKDMHRDMAKQIFCLDDDEWNKPCRQAAKNQFVFPSFYGSYYKQMAPALWNYVRLNKTQVGKNQDKGSVIEHLRKHGIPTLQKFTEHVRKIEEHFWGVRFKVYNQWKKDFYNAYLENGYFDSYTGFRYSGHFKRNDVLNYAVQGSAFHCLLKTLIMLQRWLNKYNFKSLIVGQIHDSVVMDAVPSEVPSICEAILDIVENKLPKAFTWLSIPLVMEGDITSVDRPWSEKKAFDMKNFS